MRASDSPTLPPLPRCAALALRRGLPSPSLRSDHRPIQRPTLPSLYCALAVASGGCATAAAPGKPFRAAALPPRPRHNPHQHDPLHHANDPSPAAPLPARHRPAPSSSGARRATPLIAQTIRRPQRLAQSAVARRAPPNLPPPRPTDGGPAPDIALRRAAAGRAAHRAGRARDPPLSDLNSMKIPLLHSIRCSQIRPSNVCLARKLMKQQGRSQRKLMKRQSRIKVFVIEISC
jgi:hypothetical protein